MRRCLVDFLVMVIQFTLSKHFIIQLYFRISSEISANKIISMIDTSLRVVFYCELQSKDFLLKIQYGIPMGLFFFFL